MSFQALPLNLVNANDAAFRKQQILLGTLTKVESVFSNYSLGPDVQAIVAKAVTTPDNLVWEAWREQGTKVVDFVGILRLSKVLPGCDATADYFFFDGKLRDKTDLLERWMQWAFVDHPGWQRLQRLTIEAPVRAHALIRHAKRHLGFQEEGLKRKGVIWRGDFHDLVILGRTNAEQER